MSDTRETLYMKTIWRGWTVLVLLAIAVCFPRAKCHAAPIENVIHISVDGLPSNLLEPLLDAAPASYPNFVRFVEEGASTFNARTDYSNTYTLPNHTSMVTGRPVDSPTENPLDVTHHGYRNNGEPQPDWTLHNQGNPNVAYIAGVFDVAHDYGLSTALYASKTKFVIYDQSYNATTGAPDLVGADDGRDKIDASVTDSFGRGTAVELNAAYLAAMTDSQFNYTFLHYRDPDSYGHVYGWGSSEWYFGLLGVDAYLGQVFDMVENTPGLAGRTAIVLTTDHGGVDFNHGNVTHPDVYTIPLFVWGPGVAQGADLYELNAAARTDPLDSRPTYTVAEQPIRSGGSANLALSLLGLPSIPGSSINAAQDLIVFRTGDMDLDGDLDFDDIDAWVFGVNDVDGYASQFGVPPSARGDFDRDGDFDFDDLPEFVAALEAGSPLRSARGVPEPSSGLLWVAGCLIMASVLRRGLLVRSGDHAIV